MSEGFVLPDRAAITRDWLTATLRRAGALTAGDVAALEIESLRRKSLSELLRLLIAYGPDAVGERPPSLVLKLARPGPASATMRRRRRKEQEFYAAIAPAMADSPAPRAYAAVWDDASGRSHLLLADCSTSHASTPRGLPPTMPEAAAAVDRLASVHAAWWNRPDLRAGLPLPAEIAARARSARRLVADFVREMEGRVSDDTRRALHEVAAAYPALLAEAAAGPVTLLHGDSHPWNFLHPVSETDRTILLDWESWSIGAGPNDLVALIAMRSLPDLRRERESALLRRYHAALQAAGVTGYDWEACWNDYRRGVARRLVSPLRLRRDGSGAWQSCLGCLALAYHDLGCAETLPTAGPGTTEDVRER